MFASKGRELLRPLPATGYEVSRYVYGRKAGAGGHVSFARNYNSVPYPHVGAKVDLSTTASMLEVHRGHQGRSSRLLPVETVVNAYRTHDADLLAGPKGRQWDKSRVREWAERDGP